MTWVAAAIATTAVVGAYSANKAAGAQTAAANQANQTSMEQYRQTREDQTPFRETGVQANNYLTQMMNNGQFDRKFGQSDLNNDAVYQNGLQFGLNQGTQGINRMAAAGGNFLSGATLKALTRFGNDYGSTKANESYNRFNNDQNMQYNRYAGLSGAGQQATNQIGAAGQNMANQVASNQLQAGNAQASGYAGTANAINGAIGQGVNMYQNNQLMSQLFPKGNGFYSNSGAGIGTNGQGNYDWIG